jgi:hypothetical protein
MGKDFSKLMRILVITVSLHVISLGQIYRNITATIESVREEWDV